MSDVSELERQVRELDWRDPVPDELQSAVRMEFNEALAGGPNMNGDGGPTLTPNHALDCVWATQRITTLQSTVSRLREALDDARNNILSLLGGFRDDMPDAAVKLFQAQARQIDEALNDIQSMKDGQ